MNEQLRHKWHEKKVYFEGINKKQLTWGEEEDKAIYPPVCCQSETGQAFSKLLCPHDPHTGVPTNSKYSLLETRPVRRKHCRKHNKPKGRDDIQEFASEARHSSVWEAIGWPLTNDYFWGWDGKEGGKRYRLAASAWANYQDLSYKLPHLLIARCRILCLEIVLLFRLNFCIYKRNWVFNYTKMHISQNSLVSQFTIFLWWLVR